MRAPSGATSSTTSAVTAEKKQLQQVLHTSEMTSPSSSESSVNSFTNKLEQATPEQLKSMKKEITDLQAAERGKRKSLSPNQSAVLEVIGKRVDTHLQKANEVRQKQNAFEEKIEEKVLDFAKGLDGAKNDKEKARLTTKMTNEIAKMDSSSRVEILKQVGLLLKNDEHRALGASLNTVEAVTVKIVKDNSNKAILEGLKAGHQIKDEAGNVTPLKELILFSGKDLIKLNDLFGLIHQDLVKNNGPFNEDNKLLEFCRLAIADDPKNAEMPNFKEIATLCKKNSVDMTPKETTPDLQITNGSRNAGSIFSELQTMGPADRIKAYHSLGKDLQSIQENLLTTISPSSINDETRAEITSYVQFQSKISGYFSDKISDQKTPQEQENAIKFCVDLAMYCKKNNDLMGAQAVFLSINQTQIWNLKDEGGKGIFDKVKQDGQYGAKMKELEILINMQAARGLMSELKTSGESFIPLIPSVTNKIINSKENLSRFMSESGQDQYNFQGVQQNRELIKGYFPAEVRQSPEPRTLQTNILEEVSTHIKHGSVEELQGALNVYKKAVEHHDTTPFSFEYLPPVPDFQPVKNLFLKADKGAQEEFLKGLDTNLRDKLVTPSLE